VQVDQDCFVKGEEDMLDSTFGAVPGQGVASAAEESKADGATAKVGRSGTVVQSGGAADQNGTLSAPVITAFLFSVVFLVSGAA
jgi:hypothetical protein